MERTVIRVTKLQEQQKDQVGGCAGIWTVFAPSSQYITKPKNKGIRFYDNKKKKKKGLHYVNFQILSYYSYF